MRAFGLAIVAAAGFAATAHASAITDSILLDKLIGAWSGQADCKLGALTFNADGTFSLTAVADPANDLHGSFDVKDGSLVGDAGGRAMPVLPLIFNDDGSLILGPDLLMRCPKA
jgi:hypothetical protein